MSTHQFDTTLPMIIAQSGPLVTNALHGTGAACVFTVSTSAASSSRGSSIWFAVVYDVWWQKCVTCGGIRV
jgi:hypothetical protein